MNHKKHMGFKKLETRIEREYLAKGVSLKTAKLYGKETAAKVYREQQHHQSTYYPTHHPKHHCANCGVLH